MKNVITFILLLFPIVSIAQKKKQYTPVIKGEKGESIINIDSLAFKDQLRSSLFYIDSLSKLPYNGKAVVLYGKNGIDSLIINNGYTNSLCRNYHVINGILKLYRVEYIDRENKIVITKSIYTEPKKGRAFITFYDSSLKNWYEIQYKSKVINLKFIISENGKVKQKVKLKFHSYSELSVYLQGIKVYKICESLDVFNEKISLK